MSATPDLARLVDSGHAHLSLRVARGEVSPEEARAKRRLLDEFSALLAAPAKKK